MSEAEVSAFLAELQEARLATVRADGDIHLTPVWYLALPDGRIHVFLDSRRLHLANLRRRPRATLLVDRDERPRGGTEARAAVLRCAVELVEDEAAVDMARHALIRRYRGPDAPLPRTPDFRYVLCVLTPERVTAWDFAKG
jgi:PPOX class probable F420-dependent enzyme